MRLFQTGAREAARFTNIDLLGWRQFEDLMFERWLEGITRRLYPHFMWVHQLMASTTRNYGICVSAPKTLTMSGTVYAGVTLS